MPGLRKPGAATKLADYMLPKKRILALTAVAGVAAAVAALLPEPSPREEVVQPARNDARSESRPSDESRFAALPERESIGRQKGELFGSRSWAPPPAPPKPAAKAVAEPPPPPPPAPPPMPYRVAGQVVHDGSAQVVLAKGDRVITVREGQVLEDGYRVESIRADGVMLVYIPLEARQYVPAATALALAEPPKPKAAETAAVGDNRPAQLRWEGPERVQAGNNFNVALKLTSHQPVRATPLQLSYDDKLLEPVAVRPGGFFAPGSFSYRVNPGGSIFVGGFGKGTSTSDTEFVVVTFKPIRPGTTPELKLSSVVLQGAAGRTIAHEPLAAFRTSVR